jgi:hypothetical protein
MPKRLIRDDDQDDTAAAEQLVSLSTKYSDEPETTAVDTTAAPHGLLAWEADDDDDEVDLPHVRRTWEDALSAAGLIVAVCAAVAVVVYVVHTMGSHHDAAVPAPPVTTAAAAAPAPAVTTTVTAPPVTVTATTEAAVPTTTTWTASQPGIGNPKGNPYPLVLDAAGDQRLLAEVRAKDSEREIVDSNPALVVREAHKWCLLTYQGATLDQADNAVQADTGWDGIDTTLLIGRASEIYRGCY